MISEFEAENGSQQTASSASEAWVKRFSNEIDQIRAFTGISRWPSD